jgi:hypothetical protein
MRFLNVLVVLMLFGAGYSPAALAHGVDVSKPDVNTVCKAGTECLTRWSLPNVDEVAIKIRMNDTKNWITIIEKVKNSGEYKWVLDKTTAPGTYKVLVLSTKDEEVHGVSPEFKIIQ